MALTKVIGSDLKSAPDYIFSATALGNAAAITSGAFDFGMTQGAVELVLVADAAITIASTETLTVAIHTSDTEGGSFTLQETVKVFDAGTIAAGEALRFAPNTKLKQWAKLVITSTEDLSAKTVTSYLNWVPR